jgi:hypothetical protein
MNCQALSGCYDSDYVRPLSGPVGSCRVLSDCRTVGLSGLSGLSVDCRVHARLCKAIIREVCEAAPLSLSLCSFHLHLLPLASLCRSSSLSSSLHIETSYDVRSPSRLLSPFDFQHLKLSPNDLKYPFFLLPHFFFAKTKNQTLKGQSRPAKCNSINKTSWSRSSPNVVVVAFIVVALLSLPPSSLSSLSSVFSLPFLWLLPSSFHSRTLPDTPGHDRTRPDTIYRTFRTDPHVILSKTNRTLPDTHRTFRTYIGHSIGQQRTLTGQPTGH